MERNLRERQGGRRPPRALVIVGLDEELVLPRRQVRVQRLPSQSGIDPIAVETVETISETRFQRRREIQDAVLDLETRRTRRERDERRREIAITSAMVDAFLQAGDVLHGMLDAHQNGGVADEAAAVAVKAKLEQLTRDPAAQGAPAAASVEAAPAAPSAQHTYQIRFAKSPAIFPSDAQLNNLLEDLGNLGKIENQQISEDSVSLTLTAWAGEPELRDIFSFFLEPEQLTITLQGDAAASSSDGDGAGDRRLGTARQRR